MTLQFSLPAHCVELWMLLDICPAASFSSRLDHIRWLSYSPRVIPSIVTPILEEIFTYSSDDSDNEILPQGKVCRVNELSHWNEAAQNTDRLECIFPIHALQRVHG